MKRSIAAFIAAFAVILSFGSAALAGEGAGSRGRSESNPDGGGVDKPYAADGQPTESQGPDYHDGNNGCGQDKHSGEARETGTERPGWDDNNGWCGKPPFAGNEEGQAGAAREAREGGRVRPSDMRSGGLLSGERAEVSSPPAEVSGGQAEVLGVKLAAAAEVLGAGGGVAGLKALAFTGMQSGFLVLASLQLVLGGGMLLHVTRRRS